MQSTKLICEIEKEIYELAEFLPSQLPINHFVHHNTLHAFQERGYTFHEAIRAASSLFGSLEYLPLQEYHKLYQQGEISSWALDFVLRNEKNASKEDLLFDHPSLTKPRRKSIFSQGFFAHFEDKYQINLEEKIHPLVVKFVTSYLDQGIASLSLSRLGKFWESLTIILETFFLGVPKKSKELIKKNNWDHIFAFVLEPIIHDKDKRRFFLAELLLKLPGLAGMVFQVEKNPGVLFYPRIISIKEYLALYLTLFFGFLAENKISLQEFYSSYEKEIPKVFPKIFVKENEIEKACRLWHEAYEITAYFKVLAAIQYNNKRRIKRDESRDKRNKSIQVILCVDDRNCSLRRYLEELDENVETYGTPGFFGLDILYLGPYDKKPYKQCPLPRTAKYLIQGIAKSNKKTKGYLRELEFWHRHANNLYSGYVLSHTMSLFAFFRLISSLISSRKSLGTASALLHFERPVEIAYEFTSKNILPNIQTGYKVEEMANVVEGLLRQIGLVDFFAPFVIILGHGATSTNNPYYAAYDCGACSGHPGAVNARIFATMANRDDVRRILKRRGIVIPSKTVFIGGLHDTTRDEIFLFDLEKLPLHVKKNIPQIIDYLNRACQLNAKERIRRFPLISKNLKTYKKVLKEVQRRSILLYEPRPEYNHATNFIAIVGRRSLSRGLFLDRRAFLNSYDPSRDFDGKILEGILAALIPVVGGINLEYFFSRIDNERYGAGSKLPHNVVSLIGVANGAEGDLRTGLPFQMVEIHDPLRLLLIVEQKEITIINILKRNKAIRDWVAGEWVRCVVYNPWDDVFYFYQKDGFVSLELPKIEVPINSCSENLASIRYKNIPPTLLNTIKVSK